MAKRKEQSNDEVINGLMVYGNPIKQLVIMEAITRYTDQIAEAGLDEVRRQFGENHFISPDAWYRCAVEIKTSIDNHIQSKAVR